MKALIVAMVAAAIMAVGGTAHATRVIPGADQVDLCRNMKGMQTIHDVVRHRVIIIHADKDLCRKGPRWIGVK